MGTRRVGLPACPPADGAEPLTGGHRWNGKDSVKAGNKDGVQVEGTQGGTGLTLGWTLPRRCRQLALCVGPQKRTSPSAVDRRCQPPQGGHPLTHGGGRKKRRWETPAGETSSQWGNGIGQVRKPAKSNQESGKQSRGGGGEPGIPGTPPDAPGQINAERHRILPVLDQSVTSDGLSEYIPRRLPEESADIHREKT